MDCLKCPTKTAGDRANEHSISAVPRDTVSAGRPRCADCVCHPGLLAGLSVCCRTRHRPCRKSAHGRALFQLCASGCSLVHRRSKHHECWNDQRSASAVLHRTCRPLPWRSGPRKHCCVPDLFRNVRIRRGRCGRDRQDHYRDDDQKRSLHARLCSRDNCCVRHHRANHSPIDPDGALCTRFQHLDRLPVSWGNCSGLVDGGRADGAQHLAVASQEFRSGAGGPPG